MWEGFDYRRVRQRAHSSCGTDNVLATSPVRFTIRCRPDLVNREIRAFELLLRAQPQADEPLEELIDDETADQRDGDAERGADQLRAKRYATQATECLQAEDAAGN